MTIHLEQPLSRYTVTADNRPGNSVARPPVVSVVSVDELIIFVFRRQQRQQKQQQQLSVTTVISRCPGNPNMLFVEKHRLTEYFIVFP